VTSSRFAMVVLLVEDIPRSLAFYRRLGVVFPPDADARSDLVVDIGGGHKIVWSTTFGRNDPERQPVGGGARIMLEFFVDGRAVVDAAYADLTAAGYHGRRAPWLTSFDAYMCLVDDPDGNTVLVTAT
jgi:catechol 2,3-dioxygenase-like lactoylglutathione lyase family enzyme